MMTKPSPRPSEPDPSKPLVLIVDDELAIREQLAVALAQRGFMPEVAATGVEAFERIEAARLRGRPHHCVVLDIRLPAIDGLRVLEVLKTTYPEIRTIAISGHGRDYETRAVDQHDDCVYLDKPFDLDDLAERIRSFEVRPAPEIAPVRHVPARAAAQPIHSAYVFLHAESPRELCAAFSKLRCADGVCYCDLVTGDWDLVLLLQAADAEKLQKLIDDKVQGTPGIVRAESHLLGRPVLSEALASFIRNHERQQLVASGAETRLDRRRRQLTSAYVHASVEPDAVSSVFPYLYFHPRVLYCDVAGAGRELILFVEAFSADDLQTTVGEIGSTDGVSRIRVLNILEGQDCG